MPFWTVFKKEILSVLRDKKYIAILLLPFMLYPLLYGIIATELGKSAAGNIDSIPIFCDIQEEQKQQLTQNIFFEVPVKFVKCEDPQTALKNDEIYLILTWDDATLTNPSLLCEIEYNANSNYSVTANQIIRDSLENYNIRIASRFLQKNGMDPAVLETVHIVSKTSSKNTLLVMMAPMLITITILSGCTSIAADSFAGEKERGTMEQVAVTQVSRVLLLSVKELVILIVTFIEAGVSLAAYGLSFCLFPELQEVIGNNGKDLYLNLSEPGLIWAVLITAGFVLLTGALFTVISILSKNARQATSFLGTFTILPSILSLLVIFSKTSEVRIGDMLIPIYQMVLGLKLAFCGAGDTRLFVVILLSQLFYAMVFYLLSGILIQKNKFIV